MMSVEELRHSERWFRTLIEHSTDAVVLFTRDGTVTYATPSTERVIGYTAKEFVGINVCDLVYPEDWAKISWSDFLDRPGNFLSFEYRMRHKDGNWCWMEGTLTNLLGDSMVGAIMGNYRDITERKRAQERLQQREERYRVLVEQALDGIFLTDVEGRFVEVNMAVCLLSGYAREELLTKNIGDLTRENDREGLFAGRDALLAGETLRSQWLLRRKDGRLVRMELSAKQLSNGYLQGTVRDISVRILAEQERAGLLAREQNARAEAEEARAHLHDLFMQAPAHICILRGPQHRFELANPLFLRTVALSESDVLGKPAKEALSHVSAQRETAILDEVYETGKPFIGVEMPVRLDLRGDGTMEDTFFNFIYHPFRNVHGEINGILMHGVEVTHEVLARRRVEELVLQLEAEKEALGQAEQRAAQHASHLAAIFDAITDGVVVYDTGGKILQANAAFRSLFRLDEDDRTAFTLFGERRAGMIPHDLEGNPLPKEQWPLVRALRGERLSGTDTIDLLSYTSADQPLFLNVSAAPVYDVAGEIVGGVLVLRDVTERRQLEQQLHVSERKYRSLVDSNIIGVQVADHDGKIYEANECLAEMFGYSREELLSGDMLWHQYNAPEYNADHDPVVQLLEDSGVLHLMEKEHIRKDGSRFPTLMAGAGFDREQKRAVMVFLDISDRKEAERRKQEFLGMVNHELRTPLTIIMGLLELTQIEIQRLPRYHSPEVDTILKRVEIALARAIQQVGIENRLVEALLDVSRMEMHKFEISPKASNLVTLVEEVVANQQQIACGRRIEMHLPEQEQVPVLIDDDRIRQVLVNYLTNALKYSFAESAILVGLSVEGTTARVFVRDQGRGLTPGDQERIWECFYQTGSSMNQGSDGGLGLGLYISKIIVQQHGGQVGVESDLGQGSTFWFALPLDS
jgi:PAS domain S-box-containing protein